MIPVIGLLVVAMLVLGGVAAAIARALGIDFVAGMLAGPYSRRVEKGEED